MKLIDSRSSFSDQNEFSETKKSKKTNKDKPGGYGDTVERKNHKNSKSKKKSLSPRLPNIIKEPEEDLEEGWTKIPVVSNSVVIEEMNEYDEEEISIDDENSIDIAPIVDEVEESDENTHHDHTIFEEVFELDEHEEDDHDAGQQCGSTDEEIEAFESKFNQIHLSFERFLEVQEEGCEEFVLAPPEIMPVSTTMVDMYLSTPFIEDNITDCHDNDQNKSWNSQSMRQKSFVQENEEAQENMNSGIQFCKVQVNDLIL